MSSAPPYVVPDDEPAANSPADVGFTPPGEPPTDVPAPTPKVLLGEVGDYVGRVVFTSGLVAEATKKETRDGKKFVHLVLVSRDARVVCRRWESASIPTAAGAMEPSSLEGIVVDGRFKVETYRDAIQLRVELIRPLWNVDASDYVRASVFSRGELERALHGELERMRGSKWHPIVEAILVEHRQAFMLAPASRMYHHAFHSGLAEHTLSMLRLADDVIDHYSARLNAPQYSDPIDGDLVRAGVWLHDVAKCADQSLDAGGVVWSDTDHGRLIGHISTVAIWIERARVACGMSDADVRPLLHLVLSHHGSNEFGSPVVPATAEALILHHIDMLDSKMAMWREATTGLNSGEWSAYCRPLGREMQR